jgi:hypothetical protein
MQAIALNPIRKLDKGDRGKYPPQKNDVKELCDEKDQEDLLRFLPNFFQKLHPSLMGRQNNEMGVLFWSGDLK